MMKNAIVSVLLAAAAASAEPGPVTANLEMKERLLDPEGSRKMGMMYMPSSAKVTADKPEIVKKEPAYRGAAKYATITLGNGPNNTYALAFDEPEGQDARIYIDTNANGDLTDDGDGHWPTSTPGKEGGATNYSGTWVFDVTWKNSDGKATKGRYGLNMYRSPDRETINYYRASARVGTITFEGKNYDVQLIENDNDGVYSKPVDPAAPAVVGAPASKPVWLQLDGDRFDIRGTFGFADLNFHATVSEDGSKLTMTPTMKTIRVPRAAERPAILGAGVEAPDFEAMLWKGEAESAFKLSDYKGKIVVMDLWATWCGPCRASLPHLSRLAESVKSQGVVVMALNVFDERPAYDRFVAENQTKYKFLFARDPAGRESAASIARRLFNVSAIPVTYVIGKDGKIAAAISGYREGDKEIEKALKGLGVNVE
ncbi:MAG: TlpA family protein disulfide reductase [Phycisphaerales bacterium]